MNVEKFRERLRECIKKSGMTQREIADKIGVRPATISRYLSGKSLPRIRMLCKFKWIFGVRIEYLVGRSDEP